MIRTWEGLDGVLHAADVERSCPVCGSYPRVSGMVSGPSLAAGDRAEAVEATRAKLTALIENIGPCPHPDPNISTVAHG